MRTFLLLLGFILLFAAEILRVYFIMPFPGSQRANTIDIAYWLARNILWLRVLAIAMIAWPAWHLLSQKGNRWKKTALYLFIALYAVVFYFVNFRMEADVMFYQPKNKVFAPGDKNKVSSEKIVIGVYVNGEARAYPIQFIGYHHQVTDSVGGIPVMVTYCTVCRTGRVFSPMINGKKQTFRLVGMDHFNAMFEDAGTKSWWRQVSGEAVAGPLKGSALTEIPSAQMALGAWLRKYPSALVMQPDTVYSRVYEKMVPYEQGKSKSGLTKRDSASWKDKSWVIGIAHGIHARAYDWNRLVKEQMIQDSLPGLPLIVLLEKDSTSFHAFERTVDGKTLSFRKSQDAARIVDEQTGSLWTIDGQGIAGPLSGKQLKRIQAYQEYWHSWQTFHPGTSR